MVSMVVRFPVFLSMHKRVHWTYFFGIMVYLESFGLESFYDDFGDFGSAIGTFDDFRARCLGFALAHNPASLIFLCNSLPFRL
jgi:hypothetical protein